MSLEPLLLGEDEAVFEAGVPEVEPLPEGVVDEDDEDALPVAGVLEGFIEPPPCAIAEVEGVVEGLVEGVVEAPDALPVEEPTEEPCEVPEPCEGPEPCEAPEPVEALEPVEGPVDPEVAPPEVVVVFGVKEESDELLAVAGFEVSLAALLFGSSRRGTGAGAGTGRFWPCAAADEPRSSRPAW
jgi:hypothetical protein